MWARRSVVAVTLTLLLGSGRALADEPTEAQKAAQTHFQRAKELYQSGAYRDACGELEAARALDPKAKDLLFNLGVVSEKLLRIDDALRYFQKYAEMDLTPQERGRADSTIRRLEGAKHEQKETPETPVAAPIPAASPPAEKPASLGRVDALTVTSAAVAVSGLGVGTAFGLLAMSTRPSAGTTTDGTHTYAELDALSKKAHTQALIADVGFAVGIVGVAATAVLYFARDKGDAPPHFDVIPTTGGAALQWRGAF